MNRSITFTTLLVLLTPAATVARAGERFPAFPGAEGFGAGSVGGRGGQVIKVTNLGTRGLGSLQAACSAEGPMKSGYTAIEDYCHELASEKSTPNP
jgi:hypothetical protein